MKLAQEKMDERIGYLNNPCNFYSYSDHFRGRMEGVFAEGSDGFSHEIVEEDALLGLHGAYEHGLDLEVPV
jgi:hypothetical protein